MRPVVVLPDRTTTARWGDVGPPTRPSPADRQPGRPVRRCPVRLDRPRIRVPLRRPGVPPVPVRWRSRRVPDRSRPPRRAARRVPVPFPPLPPPARSGRPDRVPCRMGRVPCRRPPRASRRRTDPVSHRRTGLLPCRRTGPAPPSVRHRVPR
ncbi:hypothetical protein CA850_18520 [Micromonospora echinospora]|nr:hypothetical protein CA850_18520 [Micromonospora echinospora]